MLFMIVTYSEKCPLLAIEPRNYASILLLLLAIADSCLMPSCGPLYTPNAIQQVLDGSMISPHPQWKRLSPPPPLEKALALKIFWPNYSS